MRWIYSSIIEHSDIQELRGDFIISTTVASLILMTPIVGYMVVISKVHMKLSTERHCDNRSLCHIIPFIVMSVSPSVPTHTGYLHIVDPSNGPIGAICCA